MTVKPLPIVFKQFNIVFNVLVDTTPLNVKKLLVNFIVDHKSSKFRKLIPNISALITQIIEKCFTPNSSETDSVQCIMISLLQEGENKSYAFYF
jgi:hypothetical protein